MPGASLPPPRRHGRLVARLIVLAGFFFAFGFALVPLYDTFCEAVGFNGKTLKDALAAKDAPPSAINYSRKLRTTRFLVRNLSDQTIVGQAVPSVSPTVAARHFRKLDCFCFTQQTLAPGESREMALTFIIDGDIGDEISELTLAYAFFLAPKDPA